MGRMGAMGMKDAVDDGLCDLNAALTWHLKGNHYPPHPDFMIPIAEEAIKKAKKGEWEEEIKMPEGVSHREHGNSVPVRVIVSSLHLEEFLG